VANQYQRKSLTLKALDVDTTGKKVKVAIAHLGNKDRDGDIFTDDAFDKTIAERGPKGTNEIWHLVDHNPSIKSALGKFTELYKENSMIVGVSSYKETNLWKDVWPLYESGEINQHSVGFSVPKGKQEQKDDYNEIREVKLWEGSSVLWGANPQTPTLGVFKSLTEKDLVDEIEKRFSLLKKGIKNEVETSLLLIQIEQLKEAYIEKMTGITQPAPIAVEPIKEFDVNAFRELIKSNFSIK
jgi:hypothetical protein